MFRVLELVNLGGETSDLLLAYVLEVLQKLDFLEKVIAVSADNTNMNFGGKKKKGKIIRTTNCKKKHQTT
jgi:hypothetical protein